MSLIYFDLDKFKPVNGTFVHEVGDWLLKSVASRVVGCIRESDTVTTLVVTNLLCSCRSWKRIRMPWR